jgi:benzoyl-CoA 2,3-dioxygenase component A
VPFPVIEGQSIGVIPPGLDSKGKPHAVRLYSVSSPRDGERPGYNNLSLTVKRTRRKEGESVIDGLASNFLCDVHKNDQVRVTGPFGNTFLMPNHPEANLVMICTGTGSAPFRAMTERRRRTMPDAPGKMLIFFGARNPDELPYFGPLSRLPKSLIEAELVFSRLADKPKEYVQDRMRTRARELAELLKSSDTYVYVCGLKGMEKGVEEAFAEICGDHDLDWRTVADEMRRTGRYHVETY